MNEDKIIRQHLLWLLDGGNAHMTLDAIIKDFPIDQINVVFPNSTYSFWGSLEHTRRTQADVLDFIKNPKYKELEWPKDYWPKRGQLAKPADWQKTVKEFKKDLVELKSIVKNPKADLYAKIPHGSGQTILREMLLVADHTAYQLGELATMRRVFGHWDITHE
jgi:hypothetical protein